jgi:hypothetical protein
VQRLARRAGFTLATVVTIILFIPAATPNTHIQLLDNYHINEQKTLATFIKLTIIGNIFTSLPKAHQLTEDITDIQAELYSSF